MKEHYYAAGVPPLSVAEIFIASQQTTLHLVPLVGKGSAESLNMAPNAAADDYVLPENEYTLLSGKYSYSVKCNSLCFFSGGNNLDTSCCTFQNSLIGDLKWKINYS